MITTDLSRHLLSKSTFMRGVQCIKALWLNKNQPALKEEISEQQEALFEQGDNVDELAKQLFPGGIDATPKESYETSNAVTLTKEFIESGTPIIYQPSFQYEGVMCRMDILVKKARKWYAYEIKSSTQVKEQYIIDSALQYYVITKAGLPLEDLSIVYINNKYVRYGDLDIKELFSMESVLDRIRVLQPEVELKIGELKTVLKLKSVPDIKIGGQCSSPYECDFKSYCWQGIPMNSVFNLRGRGASEIAFELFGKGIISLDKIPADYELSDALRLQVDSFQNNEPIIDKTGIREFLSGLEYPLYYLDFESYQTAIPEYDGSWAYEQMPFQFSLHVQKTKGGEVEHIEFLAESGKDGREDFVKALIGAVGKNGSVVVYNQAFENRIIKEMAHVYPKYEKPLMALSDRLYDLMVPFRKKQYYLPQMNGSYSIKEVLPAIVPELSYDDLEIGNGSDASAAYYNLQFEKDGEKVKEIRKNLKLYCGRDTKACIELINCLSKIVID